MVVRFLLAVLIGVSAAACGEALDGAPGTDPRPAHDRSSGDTLAHEPAAEPEIGDPVGRGVIEGWPSDLPAIAGFELAAGAPHEYPDGSRVVRLTALEGSIGALFDAWCAAVEHAGGRMENLHQGEAERTATVVIDERRYFVAFTTSGQVNAEIRQAVPGGPPLSSPCLPIPDDSWSSIVTRWGESRRSFRYSFRTSWAHDFDRDGAPDALVPLPDSRDPQHACPAGIEWDVYVSRGACGHRVGRIEGRYQSRDPAHTGLAHGFEDISTQVDVMSPRDPVQDLRYAFDGSSYRVADRTVHEARCEVHPADCRARSHTTCELRGHARVPSLVDQEEVGAALSGAAHEAQAACSAPTGVVERCDAHPTFSLDGNVATLRITDCPRRRRCVEPLFRAIRITPFVGDPPLTSISFQIPAP